jgi:hypothetical protein
MSTPPRQLRSRFIQSEPRPVDPHQFDGVSRSTTLQSLTLNRPQRASRQASKQAEKQPSVEVTYSRYSLRNTLIIKEVIQEGKIAINYRPSCSCYISDVCIQCFTKHDEIYLRN